MEANDKVRSTQERMVWRRVLWRYERHSRLVKQGSFGNDRDRGVKNGSGECVKRTPRKSSVGIAFRPAPATLLDPYRDSSACGTKSAQSILLGPPRISNILASFHWISLG